MAGNTTSDKFSKISLTNDREKVFQGQKAQALRNMTERET
jgi:hypothetical protein